MTEPKASVAATPPFTSEEREVLKRFAEHVLTGRKIAVAMMWLCGAIGILVGIVAGAVEIMKDGPGVWK